MIAVSVQPSSHPGRSDFPSPVGGGSFFHGTSSVPIEGSSARSPTPSHRHVIGPASLFVGLDRRLSGSVPGCGADSQPLPTESPFARSRCCRPRPTLQAQVGGSYPAFVALTGSCARPLSSRRLWSSLFLRVFAGCIESLLPSGPSRRYLCDPCLGAWVPYPATLRRCLCPFLPACPRPHPRVKGFGSWDDPATQFYAGGAISGLQPFAHVQAPLLAWPTDCSDVQVFLPAAAGPYTPGSIRAVTGHELRHRYVSESDN